MDFLTTFPDTSILQMAATIALEFCMNQILSKKFLPNITFTKGRKYQVTLVMCRIPFYRTPNQLQHHFSNTERTETCSSLGN